jgi:hypothetical protein
MNCVRPRIGRSPDRCAAMIRRPQVAGASPDTSATSGRRSSASSPAFPAAGFWMSGGGLGAAPVLTTVDLRSPATLAPHPVAITAMKPTHKMANELNFLDAFMIAFRCEALRDPTSRCAEFPRAPIWEWCRLYFEPTEPAFMIFARMRRRRSDQKCQIRSPDSTHSKFLVPGMGAQTWVVAQGLRLPLKALASSEW